MTEMEKVNYPLCSEDCSDKWCKNMCIMKKNYNKPFQPSNTILACCYICRICNENNLRTQKQVQKYIRRHKLNKIPKEEINENGESLYAINEQPVSREGMISFLERMRDQKLAEERNN